MRERSDAIRFERPRFARRAAVCTNVTRARMSWLVRGDLLARLVRTDNVGEKSNQ